MTDRRYTFRDHDEPSTETISFRVPRSARILLEARVAELAEIPDSGITNRTDALQDAIVKWLMLEEHARRRQAELAPTDDQPPT